MIKKLLKEAYADEQVVLIENEFGEIGIDGGFLKEAGIQIREMNSGCICCSLVGDFATSLKEVVDVYKRQARSHPLALAPTPTLIRRNFSVPSWRIMSLIPLCPPALPLSLIHI